mgnify:CR=1 FL=1
MGSKRLRQSEILKLLEKVPGLTCNSLAEKLDVTSMTIRRDLNDLSSKGYVSVVQGVAILNRNIDGSTISTEYSLANERMKQTEAKQKIGKAAATLLKSGDIILIDTGTTTEQVLNYLPIDLPLTIVGYNMNTLLAVKDREYTELIFGGGFYRRNTQFFESQENATLLMRLGITKYFGSAAGISTKGAVSCVEQYEYNAKSNALAVATKKYLLIDSSKFGKIRPCIFGDIKDYDLIITDSDISQQWINFLKKANIKYLLA